MKKWFVTLFTTRRGWYHFISLLIMLALLVAGSLFLGPPIVRYARDPERFKEYIDAFGFKGRFVFIGIQFIQVVFALIPGEFVEIGAGYAFGWLEGALLCLIGCLLATIPIFYLVRLIGKKFLFIFISDEQYHKFKFMQNEKKLGGVLFLLFFIPGTPKDLFTYLAGLTRIRPLHFFVLTTVARIPSIVSSTYAGSALGSQRYQVSVITFGVTAAVSALGLLGYRMLMKHREKKANG